MRTLADLTPGDEAQVVAVEAIEGVGGRGYRRRLLELGLLPGVRLKLLGRAPLGDPLEFELRGSRLSLRAREARHVRIRSRSLEVV